MTATDPRRKLLDDLYGFAPSDADGANEIPPHVSVNRDSLGPVIVNPRGPVHVGGVSACALDEGMRCRDSEVVLVHRLWREEHLRDKEFVQATRIAATGKERVLLQKLMALDAKENQVREAWSMQLLYRDGDSLKIKRPKWFPWVGGIAFFIMALVSLPLGAQAILLKGPSQLWVLPFALFAAGIGYGGWCAKAFILPWLMAAKLGPAVDRLNGRLGKEAV